MNKWWTQSEILCQGIYTVTVTRFGIGTPENTNTANAQTIGRYSNEIHLNHVHELLSFHMMEFIVTSTYNGYLESLKATLDPSLQTSRLYLCHIAARFI